MGRHSPAGRVPEVRPALLGSATGAGYAPARVNPSLPPDLPALLLAAAERRTPWEDDPRQTAYRLFHGYSEGCPALCVDRLGDALVVTCRPEHEAGVLEALQPLIARFATRLVVAKPGRGRGEAHALQGDPVDALEVVDSGLRFEVEPLARRNEGLYLDARPARAWLLDHSRERRVLNLFAYTGSLGVAAAAGGARWVKQVELQKRALQRAKRNLALNGLRTDDRDLIREDLYTFLRRQVKRSATFDGVVLDPPPLVPSRGAHRPTGQDFATLAPSPRPSSAPAAGCSASSTAASAPGPSPRPRSSGPPRSLSRSSGEGPAATTSPSATSSPSSASPPSSVPVRTPPRPRSRRRLTPAQPGARHPG